MPTGYKCSDSSHLKRERGRCLECHEIARRAYRQRQSEQRPQGLIKIPEGKTPSRVIGAHLSWQTKRERFSPEVISSWGRKQSPLRDSRTKSHCKRGHPLSGVNLYFRPGSKKRDCRACKRLHKRKRATQRPEFVLVDKTRVSIIVHDEWALGERKRLRLRMIAEHQDILGKKWRGSVKFSKHLEELREFEKRELVWYALVGLLPPWR